MTEAGKRRLVDYEPFHRSNVEQEDNRATPNESAVVDPEPASVLTVVSAEVDFVKSSDSEENVGLSSKSAARISGKPELDGNKEAPARL